MKIQWYATVIVIKEITGKIERSNKMTRGIQGKKIQLFAQKTDTQEFCKVLNNTILY